MARIPNSEFHILNVATFSHLLPPRELRRRVGMVTQPAFLFPGTVYRNVGFGPRRRGEVIPG